MRIARIIFDFTTGNHVVESSDGATKRIGGYKLELEGQHLKVTMNRGGNKIADRKKATDALIKELGKDAVY